MSDLLIADVKPGAIVECIDGTRWRIGHLAAPSPEGKHRWARMLRADLSETDNIAWLSPRMGVREVLRERNEKQDAGREVDPLGGMHDLQMRR